MESRSRAWAELPLAYTETAVLRELDNTVVKYVMHEPVLQGFAEWEMFQNTASGEVQAPDLAINDLGAEAFLEGFEFGLGTSER